MRRRKNGSWACCPPASRCGTESEGVRYDQANPGRLHRRGYPHPNRPLAPGFFRNMRPDDLLAAVLRAAMAQVPRLDPKAVEDVICGCAIPEGQQGLNVARIGAVLAGL